MSDLFGNPEDRFSHNEAQIITRHSKVVLLLWFSVLLVIDVSFTAVIIINELRREKTNILVSDLCRHKLGCTTTKDGWRLEISDLESRGIVLSM